MGRARGLRRPPTSSTTRTLRRYLAYLDTRRFARRPIARKAAALRAYLRYLRRHGVIATRSGPQPADAQGRGRAARVPRHDGSRRPPRWLPPPLDASSRRRRRSRGGVGVARPRRARGALRRRAAGQRVLRAATLRLRHGPRARHGARQGLEESAGSRSASRRSTRSRAWLARRAGPSSRPSDRRPTSCSSTGRGRRSRPATPRRILDRHPLPDGRAAPSARAPPRVRYAPARGRRRPPGSAGAPRPRRPRDHPDLHPRDPRPAPGRLRSDASPCLTIPPKPSTSSGPSTSPTARAEAR